MYGIVLVLISILTINFNLSIYRNQVYFLYSMTSGVLVFLYFILVYVNPLHEHILESFFPKQLKERFDLLCNILIQTTCLPL